MESFVDGAMYLLIAIFAAWWFAWRVSFLHMLTILTQSPQHLQLSWKMVSFSCWLLLGNGLGKATQNLP